jgi:hypothetical protein
MTVFFEYVTPGHHGVSSHVTLWRDNQYDSIRLDVIDCRFQADKSFDSIHTFYEVSYTNIHFVQGLLPDQDFVKQIMPYLSAITEA